jgi:hypothetical protein
MTRIILFWSSAVFRVFPRPSAALNFRGLKSAAATDVSSVPTRSAAEYADLTDAEYADIPI